MAFPSSFQVMSFEDNQFCLYQLEIVATVYCNLHKLKLLVCVVPQFQQFLVESDIGYYINLEPSVAADCCLFCALVITVLLTITKIIVINLAD